MPNTPNGYPYPADTDPIAAGAAAIQALATKVDSQLRASATGKAAMTLTSSASTSLVVTLPAGRFGANIPHVVACGVNTSIFIGSSGGVSATSFTLTARYYLGTATSASLEMAWFASTAG